MPHTPGPWSIAPHPDDAEMLEIVADYSELPEGRKVATWIAELDAGGVDDDLEVLKANADLISAAPDLLAALRAYVDWFGAAHHGDCPADDTCDCRCKPLNDAVNAAILKAEGAADERR